MRAPLLPAVLAAVTAAASGCGGASHANAAKPPPPPVELHVSSPSDSASTQGSVISVSGQVTPGDASVRVLGRSAEVVDGSFTARVPLQPGANVIDVMATARGRGPAMAAIRVTREMPVQMPDLTHLTVAAAQARVAHLGLRLQTEKGGGLLDAIFPGTPGVCTQQPAPGAKVAPGAQVLVVVAKRC